MRKVIAVVFVLIGLGYFLLVPEDHAKELRYDGLTVAEVPDEDAGSAPVALDYTTPEVLAPPALDREEVESANPADGTAADADHADTDDLDQLAQLDELGLPGLEDVPVDLPGDQAPSELEGELISGRVVDFQGRPQPGVRVRVEHAYLPAVTGTSDADGAFRLRPAEPRGELVLATRGRVLLGGECTLRENQSEGYLLVVATPVVVRGSVVDEVGQPLDGVRIHGAAPTDVLVPFGTPALPIDHEEQTNFTNARGEFELGPLPQIPGTHIEFRLDGYESQTVELPADAHAPLAVVLART